MANVHKQMWERPRGCVKSLRSVSSILCLPAIAVAISLMASTPAAAQNLVRLDVMGGPGGNSFEHICGPGRVLVGLRGYTGVWIDNVQAVCARVEASGVSDPQPEGPIFGGSRPINIRFDCPLVTAIGGLALSKNKDNPFLGYIVPVCLDFFTGNASPNSTGLIGTGRLASEGGRTGPFGIFVKFGFEETQECPAGMVAVGIHGRAGQFLDALGLICGSKPATPPNLGNFSGKEVSFQSLNFPDRYIRHRNSLGYIEPPVDVLSKKDATFKVVPGLCGTCFSLESHNYPDHYLRHQGSRLKLAKRTDEQLFEQDATFCLVAGLASRSGLSFESINYPSHYIRHRNFELWMDRFDGSDLFRKDATFQLTPPTYAGRPIGRLKLGDPQTEPDKPSRPAPAPVPPFIIAKPADVIIEYGQTQGKTTLTWDGGKNHPYAEVWVKIDGADETFIVEQGKGTREVTIEPRKTYLFILTDAGQRLATVTVSVRRP